MPMIVGSRKEGLLQWTGSNLAEILSWMPAGPNFPGPVTCVNNAGVLTLTGICLPGSPQLVPTGAYILFEFMDDNTPFPYLVNFGTGQYQQATSDLTTLGTAAVPLLTVLAPTATVTVTLKTALPDTNYQAFGAIVGSTTVIAGLSVSAATIVDASHVSFVVTLVGVASLSGQLIAWAIHN